MMFLRKIEWKIKLTTRRKKCSNVGGVKSSTHKICTRQLSWLGHLHRMNDDRIVKKVYKVKTQGRNKTGRPRIQ